MKRRGREGGKREGGGERIKGSGGRERRWRMEKGERGKT